MTAGVADVTEYVFSLSGRKVDQAAAARACKEKYQMLCVACHGAEGTGNQALGAPNLTDNIWLYGGSSKQRDGIHRHGPQRRNAAAPGIPR